MKPSVLILGVTGQDGSYLAELFLSKGYFVCGMKRKSSSLNTQRIDHIFNNLDFKLEYGDVTDYASLSNLISRIKPDFLINCAAQAHVRVSFDLVQYTAEATGVSVFNCLEVIRHHSPKTRFLTMSSSEMFGSSPPPQSIESGTLFKPQSPYAISKLMGYYAVINYREAYPELFLTNIVAFNHESPRRQETYVTRKITQAAARISLGLQDKLYLGNLKAFRDWSHSADICEAIYLIVTADKAKDWTVASGEMHSVQEFLEIVFAKLGLDWKKYVEIDQRLFRPTEVDALCGESSAIRKELGWKPKYDFQMLINEMVSHDLKLAQQEKLIKDSSR